MNLVIVTLFSPADEDGIYTDVYTDFMEASEHDLGFGVIEGYAVSDLDTKFLPDGAKDFCITLDEAKEDWKSLIKLHLSLLDGYNDE